MRERWREAVDLVGFVVQCALVIVGLYLIAFGVPLLVLTAVAVLVALVQLVW